MTKSKNIKSTRAREAVQNVKLSEFVENPDNPSVATDEDIARLAGKLKRVPLGLTAMRIAYVTDAIEGKKMVISGNKRLRVLKQAYGEDGEVPSEWFADVTAFSSDARREFIVNANVNEGTWVAELLFGLIDKNDLKLLMDEREVECIFAELPKDQNIAQNEELDICDFSDIMELKVKLTPENRDIALSVLSNIDVNIGDALIKIIRGES